MCFVCHDCLAGLIGIVLSSCNVSNEWAVALSPFLNTSLCKVLVKFSFVVHLSVSFNTHILKYTANVLVFLRIGSSQMRFI